MSDGVAARSPAPRRPLLTVVALALLWGFLGWLPISMTGVGATLGEPDVASRRQRLAIGAGTAGLVLGGLAGFIAVRQPARWRRSLVSAVTGAVVGFVSMRWDIGQPDPAGNALKAACVYAAVGATVGLRKPGHHD
jgi:hypothetical protein